MSERQPVRAEREVTPKDVFARSNMPSRWERLTNVAPKTAQDRKYLAFVAARYRGDKRLAHPDELDPPDEIHSRRSTLCVGLASAAVGIALTAVGQATHLAASVVAGILLLGCALVAIVVVYVSTQPAVSQFYALKSRCEQAEFRLHADPMDSENTSTVNKMIRCDEGTLAYCAAKIASEIEQDSNWRSSRLEILPIDLREELAEVGESASQITEDREATTALESSRLRDDPDVRATVDEDKALTSEALTLLAARVYAFADYRDEVLRLSMYARRDSTALSRAVRRVADQQARERLL
jgi:hypothetical protein